MKLDVGQVVDRYTVERLLGAGGTAMVYLARHKYLHSRHALKVLTISSNAIKERMQREGRLQNNLKHLNLVHVSDVLDIEGAPALVMDFIDGPTLEQALQRYRLTQEDAEVLFSGILSGVRVAHEANLVHRDLKPANILLARTPEGFVPKVTDFGLAKVTQQDSQVAHTRQGISMGTPSYMAPEQIRDARNVDQRADVWSLGCVLYELMTMRRAFPGDEALAIYNAVVDGRYEHPLRLKPELPERIVNTIVGCLALDREDRIPSCDVLAEVLRGDREWEHGPALEFDQSPLPRGPSLASDAPSIPLAARGPAGATPGPAPDRDSSPNTVPQYALGEGLLDALGPADMETSEVFDPGTVMPGTRPAVDGTLAPPDSLEEEPGWGWLAWLALVGFLGGGTLAASLAFLTLVGGLALTGPTITPGGADVVVDPPAPVVAPAPVRPAPTIEPKAAPVVAPVKPEPKPVPVGVKPAPKPVPEPVAPTPTPQPAPVPVVVAPEPTPEPQPTVSPEPAPDGEGTPAAGTEIEVVLLSYPHGARIQLNGQDAGRTPKRLKLAPGTYPVQMTSGTDVGEFVVEVAADGPDKWCYKFPAQSIYIGTCP